MSQDVDDRGQLTTPPPGHEIEDVQGVRLETLGDVRRELGRLYRLLKKGLVAAQSGGVMANTLGVLAKSMDAADIRQYSDEELYDEVMRRRGERKAVEQ